MTIQIKESLFWLTYVTLGAASLLFIHQTLTDFMKSKTYLITTTSMLSDSDIPTFTICFMRHPRLLEYNKDLSIVVFYSHTQGSYKLTEGYNKFTDAEGTSHKMKLKRMTVMNWVPSQGTRDCWKISHIQVNIEQYFLGNFAFVVDFKVKANPIKSVLYISSEENAYGALAEKWYDGVIEPYTLLNGTDYAINIAVKEFHYLKSYCQTKSYYQCLAAVVADDETCPGEECTYYTLPTRESFEDHIECNHTANNTQELECRHARLWSLYLDPNICRSNKAMPCTVREYTWQDKIVPVSVERNGFSFQVWMETAPSSKGRTLKPLKTVYEEHYLMDWLEVIGTIGGTMGMMTGFSFMGSITSITELLAFLSNRLRNRKTDVTELTPCSTT